MQCFNYNIWISSLFSNLHALSNVREYKSWVAWKVRNVIWYIYYIGSNSHIAPNNGECFYEDFFILLYDSFLSCDWLSLHSKLHWISVWQILDQCRSLSTKPVRMNRHFQQHGKRLARYRWPLWWSHKDSSSWSSPSLLKALACLISFFRFPHITTFFYVPFYWFKLSTCVYILFNLEEVCQNLFVITVFVIVITLFSR